MKRLLFLLCFLAGCGSLPDKAYRVGVDASFFPLGLKGQEVEVSAFANELLTAIAKDQDVVIRRVPMNWDNLIEGLHRGKYEGILSSLSPNLINADRYSFSAPLLKTGPVLVLPKQLGKPPTLNSLSGQTIAMGRSTEELNLMQTYPNIEFVFYQNPLEALEGVLKGQYSAALVPILIAGAYIRDRFPTELMIASAPLTPQAIRLVTIKNEEDTLVHSFDQGLSDLQRSGSYQALLTKWSLCQ